MFTYLPAALPQLSPTEQVADAIYRAVDAFDLTDPALLEGSVTEDVVFTMGGREMKGRTEVLDTIFASTSKLNTLHCLSNVRVLIGEDGHTATMTCHAVARHMPPGTGPEPGAPHLTTGAHYHMNLVLNADEAFWRISKWELHIVYRDGDRSVMESGKQS